MVLTAVAMFSFNDVTVLFYWRLYLKQKNTDLVFATSTPLTIGIPALFTKFFKRTPYESIMEKMQYNSENVVRQRIFKCKKRLIELIRKDSRYQNLKDL